MANLAASGVTVNSQWNEGGLNGKRRSGRNVTLVITSMGTATNNIPAAVLGLSKIESSTAAVKSDNTVILPTTPSANGALLLLGGGASNAPADYTGTFTLTVYGQSI